MVNAMWKKIWRAFTLIELLVVLAIIATLLTIVVPRYFGQADKAKALAAASRAGRTKAVLARTETEVEPDGRDRPEGTKRIGSIGGKSRLRRCR